MPLNQSHITKLIRAITPYLDETGRRSIVETALYGEAVVDQIDWSGSSKDFSTSLIALLDRYGNVEEGRPAVRAVMEEIRLRVGYDKQREIDTLLEEIYKPQIEAVKVSTQITDLVYPQFFRVTTAQAARLTGRA